MPRPRLTLRLLDLLLVAPLARRRYLVGPLPPTGPLVVAVNRFSFRGGAAVAAAVGMAGRRPRLVDHLRRGGTEAAREVLRRGGCVVYPAEALGQLLSGLDAPIAPVALCVVPGGLLPPRRGTVVVTSPPVVTPPVDTARVTAAVTAELARVREILDDPAKASARPARPAHHPRRGDERS